MSFRSMLLLRRSTDLDEGKKNDDEDIAVSRREGAVVVVETRPKEMSHLAAILESLNFQTLSVTEDSVALRLIYERSPQMVLSSRRLPRLEGYNLRRDLPQTVPFIYLPESQQPEVPQDNGPHEGQLLKGVAVPFADEEGQPSETVVPIEEETRTGPVPEENLATAEDIVRGFRESEVEEEEFDLSDETGESLEDPAEEQDEDDEDLARIHRYRAEYKAQQKNQERPPEQSTDDSFEGFLDPRPQSPEEADSPPEGRRVSLEQAEVPQNIPPQGDLIPPDPEEEYSIIERIDAEEIASFSHGDIFSEKSAETDPSPHLDLYQEARSYVLDSIRAVDDGKIPDLIKGESIAERVVSSVEAGSELLLSATDRRQEFAISSHSVNTAVFAVRVAKALGLSRWQRLRIALAALLHEIGVVRLPKQLIYKAEKPTLEEIKILRQRPVYAARCLKGVDSRYEWLSEVVGQVYERENGTGHPLGLTGREICEEAKVTGIADLFDACIHRRPYREALTGYQALFELTTDQARTFSDRIVKALIKSLSLFPYNEYVVLSSGEIGKVVEINLENLSRPVIEVIYDKEGAAVETAKPINLAQNPSLYISKALPYRSLPAD